MNTKEVCWFYHGPDSEVHGPYPGKDMVMWTQSGYFKDSLLIRTEHEERFHSLGEWTRMCSGKLPFLMPVMSMDHLVSMQQNPMNPMMMVPPGLPPPFPPPVRYAANAYIAPQQPQQHHGAHHQPAGGHHGGQQGMVPSQPPSEPMDGGSLSHTPDSELDPSLVQNSGMGNNQQQPMHPGNNYHVGQGDGPYQHSHHQQQQQQVMQHLQQMQLNSGAQPAPLQQRHAAVMTCAAPQLASIGCGTEPTKTNSVATQTLPIVINSKDAARILSELLGQLVHVT